jgi:hypothetical protein
LKTRPERDPQQTAQLIYSIPCEWGRSYIGDTGRPLTVWLREHRHSLKKGLVEKSKFAQHAYEDSHGVGWDDARTSEIENNSRYRKYKDSVHMTCFTNKIIQSSLGISLIWIPLINNEVSNPQRKSV